MTVGIQVHRVVKVYDNKANRPTLIQMQLKCEEGSEVCVFLELGDAVMIRDFLATAIAENWGDAEPEAASVTDESLDRTAAMHEADALEIPF